MNKTGSRALSFRAVGYTPYLNIAVDKWIKMAFCLQMYNDEILLGRLSIMQFQHSYLAFTRVIQESFLNGKLLHVSISPDEVSVFYEKSLHSLWLSSIDTYGDTSNVYRALELHCFDNGINHVGIVSSISQVLSKNNISMLYINTYSHNFVLVHQNDYEKAIDALSQEGMVIYTLKDTV